MKSRTVDGEFCLELNMEAVTQAIVNYAHENMPGAFPEKADVLVDLIEDQDKPVGDRGKYFVRIWSKKQ